MSNIAKTVKFVANTVQNFNNMANKIEMDNQAAESFVVSEVTAHQASEGIQDISPSIATDIGKFRASLDSGMMLTKSLKTGEAKTLVLEPNVVLKNSTIGQFEIRDARVRPKHNFTKADPGMVNIFAHKGPDESTASTASTGWGRK